MGQSLKRSTTSTKPNIARLMNLLTRTINCYLIQFILLDIPVEK